ncbi:D-alanyl-D-alanine carboxypeptidase family protein [Clostridium sp. KNHs205]|jgi:serine-type D-Ala-D-Ala carboxypeptidase (penicillin-binding protein 5/6)|uniref:D-alanyl-D-alanine carboxypeptidase family protein n=1 Tax=Clostridium sp. KNHs205 TaxID=1449050 RepID=UPI00068D153D|nr:D-alanyl-D-alanine carboxypeptidase family protein [Clostridium sp. KNHs205]
MKLFFNLSPGAGKRSKLYTRLICFVLITVLLFSYGQGLNTYAETSQDTQKSQEAQNNQDTENNQEQKSDQNTQNNQNTSNQNAAATADAAALDISSESAVLIEGSTGTIIYEKNKDQKRNPASITKIMTLLLIFEALASGKIKLEDQVSVSEYAASMGGSQVYLEPFETQDVNTMIKCISIASANDASVAMAEYIAGSEESFVNMMNAKAKELGMNNTNFVNSCGLDVDNHYSTAYDVALMSRELITKYPQISEYSTVWMDTITHTTKKGQSEFGLTNTNKLIKSYNGITGLKTGSTSLAKYCFSATAKRDGMDMIAVVMAAPETKVRFREAAKMMDYGFANCSIYSDENTDLAVTPIPVKKGVADTLNYRVNDKFSYLCLKGTNPAEITKTVTINESVSAPVKENDKVGEVTYQLDGKTLGKVDIVAAENIAEAKFKDYFKAAFKKLLL